MLCLLAAPWVQLSVSAGSGWAHNAAAAAGICCCYSVRGDPWQYRTCAWRFAAIPDVNMSCDGRTLKACFRSASDIVLSASEFRLEPNCSTARFYRADVGDVCLELDMSACPQSHTKVCCRANFAVIGYCRFGFNGDRLDQRSYSTYAGPGLCLMGDHCRQVQCLTASGLEQISNLGQLSLLPHRDCRL